MGIHVLATVHEDIASLLTLDLLNPIQEVYLLVADTDDSLTSPEPPLKLLVFDSKVFDLLLREISVFVIVFIVIHKGSMGLLLAVLRELRFGREI